MRNSTAPNLSYHLQFIFNVTPPPRAVLEEGTPSQAQNLPDWPRYSHKYTEPIVFSHLFCRFPHFALVLTTVCILIKTTVCESLHTVAIGKSELGFETCTVTTHKFLICNIFLICFYSHVLCAILFCIRNIYERIPRLVLRSCVTFFAMVSAGVWIRSNASTL